MRKFLFFGACIVFLMSCSVQNRAARSNSDKKNSASSLVDFSIIASIGEKSKRSDLITIQSVDIQQNKMMLEVSYSGGCEQHTFELIGSKVIEKSLPPIRSIQLVHHSNSDTCKKLITSKIEVDISSLAYRKEAGSELFLTLDGWKEKLKYVYFN